MMHLKDQHASHKLIGVFGGTFDPIHFGHINALNQLQRQLNFERVHWVLSARPPHKNGTSANSAQRFEMLQLALSEMPDYIADDCEIRRAEKSYTIDTIEHFKKLYPEHRLCLIIGGDSFIKLPTWHRYAELIEMVHIVVMARPGYKLENSEVLKTRKTCSLELLAEQQNASIAFFEHSRFDISSTRLRAELFAQKNVSSDLLKDWLPEKVINYIQATQSYKIAPDNSQERPMSNMNPEQIKNHVVDAVEDIKANDVRVIDINDISDFADYMVVVSGTSDTHVRAIARAASDQLRKLGVMPLSENGADIGEWVLVDFGDVVLHVMRPEVREYYDLEKLWDEDVRELVRKHREQAEG